MHKYLFLFTFLSLTTSIPVNAQGFNRFDILITELFPDPSPSIGLPASEFIELKNLRSSPVNLHNWKFSDGNNIAILNTNFLLQPDSFVIICPAASENSFAVYGATIGVSGFPSLNNDADNITLYSPEGRIIHSISYANAWYQNELKAQGGWTLEMIDTKNPCGAAANYRASINDNGGTPGRKNSIEGINKDEQFPALLRTYTIDSLTILAVFDESLDSMGATNINNYRFGNATNMFLSVAPIPPLFNEVILHLNYALKADSVYQLSVNYVSDCAGNTIGMMNTAKAGLPVIADTFDLVINELLFNPTTSGYDFVEFYNRSNNIIDCKQLYVANRSNTGGITNSKQLLTSSFLCFPGEYLVITENKKWMAQNYVVKYPTQVIEMSALPPLPDDKGNLLLLNHQGKVIDELSYEQQWHFALIDNKEGISLERINYNNATQLKSNWTSAASTAGFGTPSYQNSQFGANTRGRSQISVFPKVFSPDNDGVDDFAIITCQFTDPGYVATITIFDIAGRMVRSLVKNALLSSMGIFRWDGLNDRQQKLPTGNYIILTEIFNLKGKTNQFKNVVTLGRRF